MRTVGELFGRANAAASVLDSAGVIRRPSLTRAEDGEEVRLAAKGHDCARDVKGDVHDIGKNWSTHPVEQRIQGRQSRHQQRATRLSRRLTNMARDAIGLSGLLVKSTLEMKYVIQDLERQKWSIR